MAQDPNDVTESVCISCGKKLNAATSIDANNRPPDIGDFTICFYCGHIMVFGDELILRDPTVTEMWEIAGNKDLLKLQRVRGMLNH
jgi:hypothetical protein